MESTGFSDYTSSRPLITAVVATFNEEKHIASCLRGLLEQRGVEGQVEVLVVDGLSTDKTVQVIRDLPGIGSSVRLLENPKRLQVFAWNIGLKAAKGRYFVTISAHTEYAPDYLASCLEVIRRTGASSVGGVQVPVGDTRLGDAIAWTMQSPFGIGNANFRYSTMEQRVESVFGGFFEKSTIDALGGFDETNFFDEDDELNYRLRKLGGSIIVSPAIKVKYHVRSSLVALWKQMFRYGFWRRRTQLQHPESIPVRVFIPPLFVLALVVSLSLIPLRPSIGLTIPALYVVYVLGASVFAIGQGRRISAAIFIPIALAVMHVGYGVGWWVGFFTHKRERNQKQIQPAS